MTEETTEDFISVPKDIYAKIVKLIFVVTGFSDNPDGDDIEMLHEIGANLKRLLLEINQKSDNT